MGKMSEEKATLIAKNYVNNGFNKTQALRDVGYSENGITGYASRLIQHNVVVRQKIQEELQSKAEVHLANIHDLALNAKHETVRLQASKDWLDRCGYNTIQKIENLKINVDGKKLDELNRAIKELQERIDEKESIVG